jgi:hypothetical protein
MANSYTDFATFLPLKDQAQIDQAMEIYKARSEWVDDGPDPWFFVCDYDSAEKAGIYITSDEGGGQDDVIEFVKEVAKKLGLTGKWGFEWAHTCDRARVDEFGGGAAVIDLATGEAKVLGTQTWLAEQLA